MSDLIILSGKPKSRFPGHPVGAMCNAPIYTLSSSPGEAAASLVSNLSGVAGRRLRYRMELSTAAQEDLSEMIDVFLEFNPASVVEISMYTPRGRKRRGLRTKQRRLLRVRMEGHDYYVPGVHYYGEAFTVTSDGINVRCRCQTTPAISRIRTMQLWPFAA